MRPALVGRLLHPLSLTDPFLANSSHPHLESLGTGPGGLLTSASGGAGCVSSSAFSRITFARCGAIRFSSEYSKIQSRAWSSSTGGSLVMMVER